MKPMFLPAVEAHAEPSPYVHAIQMMQQAAKEYPQIWHLFAFKPAATDHLARFTQEIMREEAPLCPLSDSCWLVHPMIFKVNHPSAAAISASAGIT